MGILKWDTLQSTGVDKVGPLKDNARNIITQGFLMAEKLNMHFSSVFT